MRWKGYLGDGLLGKCLARFGFIHIKDLTSPGRYTIAARLDAHRECAEHFFARGETLPSWLIEQWVLTDNYLLRLYFAEHGYFPEVGSHYEYGYVRPRPQWFGVCTLPR
ncbi:hypothetical protein ACP3V3_16795 [Vibrio sp. PNB22_3_1]